MHEQKGNFKSGFVGVTAALKKINIHGFFLYNDVTSCVFAVPHPEHVRQNPVQRLAVAAVCHSAGETTHLSVQHTLRFCVVLMLLL